MRKLTVDKMPEKYYAYIYEGKPILNVNLFLAITMAEQGNEAYEFDSEKEMYKWATNIIEDIRCVHYTYCNKDLFCNTCPSAEMGAIC